MSETENNDALLRLEIIMSQSIEDDFVNAFMNDATGQMFTKVDKVMGRGISIPKMGDSIWPQLNCMYIVYCTKKEAECVISIVNKLRNQYPNEGLAAFCSEAHCL